MNILTWPAGERQRWHLPKSPTLPPVPDASIVAEGLKLEQRAIKDAQFDSHADPATRGNREPHEIASYVRNGEAALTQHYKEQLREIESVLARLPGQIVSSVDECLELAQHEIHRIKAAFGDSYCAAYDLKLAAGIELRAFCERMGVKCAARLLASPALHWAGLLALVLFEAAVNAVAFGIGSPLGVVGGLATAFVVALINIAFGVAAGFAVRYVTHVSPALKLLGIAAAAAYAGFLLSYTLLIGHYRAALAEDWETASHAAMEHLLTSPWQVGDVQTVLLMLASVGFALLAMLTAIYLRHPYPGYASVHLKHRQADEQVAALRNDYRTYINHAFDTQIQAVDERLHVAREARHALGDRVRGAGWLSEDFEESMKRWSQLAQELYHIYQSAYQRTLGLPVATVHQSVVLAEALPEPSADLAAAQRLAAELSDIAKRDEEACTEAKRRLLAMRGAALVDADAFFDQLERQVASGKQREPRAPGRVD